MQLAPNGKILVSNNSSNKLIDVIHQPNAPGLACQYQKSAIVLPANSEYNSGFSNCISSDFQQRSISFPPEAPDSICNVNVPTNYFIKNVICEVDSIHWALTGLSGTIISTDQYASVTYTGPGQGQLIITANPTATTTWTVIAQTPEGCLSLDTLHWQIVNTLFRLRDTAVCIGQTIDLYGVTLPADTTVQFLRPSPGPGCDTLLTVQILVLPNHLSLYSQHPSVAGGQSLGRSRI